jgi:hypothetical protein
VMVKFLLHHLLKIDEAKVIDFHVDIENEDENAVDDNEYRALNTSMKLFYLH